jgi:hypothetical protein
VDVPASSVARGWALASYLVAHAGPLEISTVAYRGRQWSAGSDHGWQRTSDNSPTATDSVVIE